MRNEEPEALRPLADQPLDPAGEWVQSAGGPLRLWWIALGRLRRLRRPRWWEEVLFIGISYGLYSTVRNAAPEHATAAFHRAGDLLRVEHDLHIDVEHTFNDIVASSHLLAYVSSYWYAAMHFAVTIGVLVWLYVRHPLRYRPIRTVLYTTNILALGGFWFYALAPPRMLAGFVDSVDRFPTVWGSWDTAGVAKVSNQLAAMPSLHIGWSTWAGLVLFKLARHRWARIAGIAYPLITVFVILGTANHFLLDAVGGLFVLGLSFGIERLLLGRPTFDSPLEVRRRALWRH